MNDEEYGIAVLSVLRSEPPATTDVNISRAMRDGRRSGQRRRWGTALTAAAAVAVTAVAGGTLIPAAGGGKPKPKPTASHPALPVDPTLPTSCTVAKLPLGGITGLEPTGADITGHWQVGTVNANNPHNRVSAVVWHDGQLVGETAVTSEQGLRAINSSGVAVGFDAGKPFSFANGVRTTMKGNVEPASINNSGVVVGSTDNRGSWRWSSVTAQPVKLPDIAGAKTEGVYLIGDDGLAIGNDLDRGKLLFWYPDGHTRAVAIPTGADMFHPDSYLNGWVYISGFGQNAGYRYSVAANVWQSIGDNPKHPTPGPSGQLVMYEPPAQIAPSAMMQERPGIYIGTKPYALPEEPGIGEERGYTLVSISVDGRRILGESLSSIANPDDPVTPLTWTCQ